MTGNFFEGTGIGDGCRHPMILAGFLDNRAVVGSQGDIFAGKLKNWAAGGPSSLSSLCGRHWELSQKAHQMSLECKRRIALEDHIILD